MTPVFRPALSSVSASASAALALLLGLSLPGCGGGGGGGGGQTYTFQAPAGGSTAHEQALITDSLGATVTVETDVVASHPNGVDGYVMTADDTTAATVVDGITFGGQVVVDAHGADGTLNERTTTQLPGGASVACAYAPPAQPLPWPLHVGQAWNAAWARTCSDNTSATFALTNGHVIATESLTVGAGTFTALHARYDLLVTRSPSNEVALQGVDTWVDTLTSRTLKTQVGTSYLVNAPSGAYVSNEVRTLAALH